MVDHNEKHMQVYRVTK